MANFDLGRPRTTSDDLKRHIKAATVMKLFILFTKKNTRNALERSNPKSTILQLATVFEKKPQKHTLVGSLGHFKGPTVLTINLYFTKYINVHIAVCIRLQFLAHWYFTKLNLKRIDSFLFCHSGLLETHKNQNQCTP